MRLYAGVDTDGRVKLFSIESGIPRIVTHEQWLDVLAEIEGAVPGEMLRVQLWREDNFPKDATWNPDKDKGQYRYRLLSRGGNIRTVHAAYMNIDEQSGVLYFLNTEKEIVHVAFRESLAGVDVLE